MMAAKNKRHKPRRLIIILSVIASIIVFLAISMAIKAGVENSIVKVSGVPDTGIKITPSAVVIPTGAAQKFDAFIDGSLSDSVTFNIQEGNSGGQISADGNYTAPQNPGTYHLTVANNADQTQSASAAITVYDTPLQLSEEPYINEPGWILETIVSPAKISAPFDVAVLPDGRVLASGTKKGMVSIDVDTGDIQETEYSVGGTTTSLDVSNDGTLWAYNFAAGELFSCKPGQHEELLASVPQSYFNCSMAVAPDGKKAYMTRNISGECALYSYDKAHGLVKIAENTYDFDAVEVTEAGKVFVAVGGNGIFQLIDDKTLVPYYNGSLWVQSDSLTSDKAGNLYFDSGGTIYKLSAELKLTTITTIPPEQFDILGMAYDEERHVLLGARKETHDIVKIDENGVTSILKPSGLCTCIALAIHPDGDVYINGDEVGVLHLEPDGVVTYFKTGIICYQPPAAGIVFDENGLLYYTEAAPGFPSGIMTIDSNRNVNYLTKDVGCPAGIDIAPDGRIFYADYEKGGIYQLMPDGKSVQVATGIPYPVGLVAGPDNTLWVSAAFPGEEIDPHTTNESIRGRILKCTSSGKIEEVYRTSGDITYFDADENGDLYIPDGHKFMIQHADGTAETIADGFGCIRDAKIAKDGSIYISDYGVTALYRLRKAD